MKIRMITLITILALAFAALAPGSALAQAPAYQTSFTTSITYQNVDTQDTTTLHVLFYADPTTTTPIDITQPDIPNLKAGAGTSLYVGGLGTISAGFKGSAIMQSDRLLVATLVQLPQSTTVKNRPLSNGFSAGSPTMLIATVLKNIFGSTTIFSVQNTDNVANTLTIQFYNTSAVKVTEIAGQVLQPGASFYVDAGTIAALGTSFNGSVVATAKRGDNTDGSIVASAMELGLAGNDNYANAFEGVASGARTFYMPSALCNAFGGQNTSYAVQNTSLTTETSVTVTYSNGTSQTQTIGGGAKKSFPACSASGMPNNFSGSAKVESTATDIIAIGKAFGTGLSTAFLGAASGSPKLAMPYVRWSETQYLSGARQHANIAIQNISGATIPAGQLSVKYYDKDGNLVTTDTTSADLTNGSKWNSTPFATGAPAAAEFGYVGGFGGSAIVECTAASCQIVALTRISSRVGTATVAEDYNGIPIP